MQYDAMAAMMNGGDKEKQEYLLNAAALYMHGGKYDEVGVRETSDL